MLFAESGGSVAEQTYPDPGVRPASVPCVNTGELLKSPVPQFPSLSMRMMTVGLSASKAVLRIK